MIFFNLPLLSEKLREDKLTGREKISYVIADSIVLSFVLFLASNIGDDSSRFENLMGILSFLVSGILMFIFYPLIVEENEKGDGKNLIERVVCLSWPITCRIGVLSIGFFTILESVFFTILSDNSRIIIGTLAEIGIEIYIYLQLRDWMRITSKPIN